MLWYNATCDKHRRGGRSIVLPAAFGLKPDLEMHAVSWGAARRNLYLPRGNTRVSDNV